MGGPKASVVMGPHYVRGAYICTLHGRNHQAAFMIVTISNGDPAPSPIPCTVRFAVSACTPTPTPGRTTVAFSSAKVAEFIFPKSEANGSIIVSVFVFWRAVC